jgi:predicted phosphodiesterase
MKRRSLLTRSLWLFLPFNNNANLWKNKKTERGAFSKDGNRLRFYQKEVTESFSCLFIADTHLFKDDERGNEFTMYSGRMAKAYNKTKHFLTGEETHPEKAFVETLQIAKKENISLLILAGDIFSFPSEAAISFVMDELQKVGIPYMFTAGNHDWHYEGMLGSSNYLRETWIKKRLTPLYQGENPLYAVRKINGIRILTIDNSTYEIKEEQLTFFKEQLAKDEPILLCVHIPFYIQGRGLGFGCAHPEWSGKNDKNFALERREKWSEGGHSIHTLSFYSLAKSSNNIIGIISGHIHQESIDIMKNGVPQIVAPANAYGGYLSIKFEKET